MTTTPTTDAAGITGTKGARSETIKGPAIYGFRSDGVEEYVLTVNGHDALPDAHIGLLAWSLARTLAGAYAQGIASVQPKGDELLITPRGGRRG